MPLNDQERRFAQELVKGCSIAEAARKAGYADSTAKGDAPMWLRHGDSRYKPELVKYIEQLRDKIEKKSIASAEEVLQFLTKVIRSDASDIADFDGFGLNPKSFEEMGEASKLIKKIKYRKGDGTEIEPYSKMDAAEKLLKVHGAYAPEKTEQDITIHWEEKKNYIKKDGSNPEADNSD